MILIIKGCLLVKCSAYRKDIQIYHFLRLTKLEQQQSHLISWSRIIMVAEICLGESIFFFFLLASLYCVLFGRVKKAFWHVFILNCFSWLI